MDIAELSNKIISGDRLALSRGITIVESAQVQHRQVAHDLLEQIANKITRRAHRIAVSGAPGVGKSTFIEDIGTALVRSNKSVAVLAIDPSSQETGGSILGDKTRMSFLSKHSKAFIRPTPSTGKYGGIGESTYETIQLCEAAGYQVIFVETVGAGQSEIEARHLCDLFLLLLQPGAGDDLQGIKRGIMEVADQLIITKNDGALAEANNQLRKQLEPFWKSNHPNTPILTYSSQKKSDILNLWQQIEKQLTSDVSTRNKANSDIFWFREKMKTRLLELLLEHYEEKMSLLELEITSGNLHYLNAVSQLVDEMKNDLRVRK